MAISCSDRLFRPGSEAADVRHEHRFDCRVQGAGGMRKDRKLKWIDMDVWNPTSFGKV